MLSSGILLNALEEALLANSCLIFELTQSRSFSTYSRVLEEEEDDEARG